MIAAGVDVFRLNFSHGTHQEHKQAIETIRQLNRENSLHICILADLQGPKLRIGHVQGGHVFLKEGKQVIFTTQESESSDDSLYINYPEFPKDVAIGDKVLLDDGKLELEVTDTDRGATVTTKVLMGGYISSNKGVNLPDTEVSLPSLTPKDWSDLEFSLDQEVEWIALSFVRSPKDVQELQDVVDDAGKFSKVIAKIEKPAAVQYLEAIIDASDGIMIARGDLGVEIPIEELPLVQKKILEKSINDAKPVIIATQIMESMIENPKPTRAESNDVANAVLDRADALMLSAETSIGKYPVAVIEHMEKVIHEVEEHSDIYTTTKYPESDEESYLSDAICQNSVMLADQVNAQAIIGMTKSGYTAFKTSSHRPRTGVFIFSHNTTLLNTLSLVWGVRSFYYDRFISTDQTFEDVINILKKEAFLERGDVVVNTASMPIHEKGKTNMIKLSTVD
jgi:pyruvate kinase